MSFQYPDFSKYFTGKQQLPTEIMMLIHDWGREMLRQRGQQIYLTKCFLYKPLWDNWVYNIAPRTSFKLNSTINDATEPFTSVNTPGKLYMEYHFPSGTIIRRVHSLKDYSLISKEILLQNGKVIKRKLKNKFNKESFP